MLYTFIQSILVIASFLYLLLQFLVILASSAPLTTQHFIAFLLTIQMSPEILTLPSASGLMV